MAGEIEVEFEVADPGESDVVVLLEAHLSFAAEHSPPEDVHALDLDGLRHPGITFLAARRDGVLLGVGALKVLDDTHGELKSMHTLAAVRGSGVGAVILQRLVDEARARGLARVSLETGFDGGVRRRAPAVCAGRVRRVRAVRRLLAQPAQHVHDPQAVT